MAYEPKNPNGQATMANSEPVVIASDQSAIPVSLNAGTNYIGKTRLTDGTTDAEVVPLTGYNAQAVAIVDGSGNQITTFGGGTQYTESDTDASITGTAMLMEGAGDTLLPVQGTVTDGLLVNLGTNNDVTVSGSVNVGTVTTITNVVHIDDNAESLTVDGTVAATQSGSWIISANSGVDIGDVTINNASGASAVNIQDGGGAITVDNGGIFAVQSTLQAGSAIVGKVGIDQTTPGTTNATSIAQIGANTVSTGNGTAGTGCQRVTIASDNTAFSVNATDVPATSGGLTTYHLVSANTTNATNIKASAGQLYGYYIYNNNSSMRKVAFHNTSGTPTAGASIFFTVNIPGSSAANCSFEKGIAFSSGIAITTVTDVTDAGTTAVGTSDLTINLFYK